MEQETVARIREAANKGIEAVHANRREAASRYFNEALNHVEDVNDGRTRRDELAVLSGLLERLGFPDLALMAAEDSVILDRELKLDRLLHQDLLAVGNAHLNLGNVGKAEACYREALDIALGRGDWANAASASTNLGNVAAQREDFPTAIEHYEKSLEYLAKEPFPDTEMNTRMMLLQVSEIQKVDVERVLDNARRLCEGFWKDMDDFHRRAAAQFIVQAADRYLAAHPSEDPERWKARSFPTIFA